MTHPALALSFLAPFLSQSPSPSPLGGFDARRVPELGAAFEIFTELADKDRSGEVTAAEVAGLNEWLAPMGGEGVVEFTTEILFQGLDRDELRAWTPHDLVATFEHLDGNGDGAIGSEEATLERLCNGEMGTRGVIRRIASELVLEEADVDGDGIVSADERAALIAAWGDRGDMTVAAKWIEASKKREPADRNRMSPGVAFLTLESDIDQDRDGAYDLERYWAWFKDRDVNGDGTLSMEERRPRRGAGAASGDRAWRRPTAERMALPALMPWQRNLKGALAVQKRTGQALLICVNMDGETACDSLAAWRYRDEAFAELAAGYVCLVVSPDDHQALEYDDRGRRMVSPRLGRVTDREHIDLEPALYERYFEGRRVAPRHVGVDVDGTVLFDVYMINDPGVLDAKLREYARPGSPMDWTSMDGAVLAEYPDAGAREELERRMLDPDAGVRLEYAAYAGSDPDAGMLGLRDPSPRVRDVAALALAARAQDLDGLQIRRLLQSASGLGEAARAAVIAGLTLRVDGDSFAAASLQSLDPATRLSSLGNLEDWSAAASLSSLTSLPIKTRDEALAALEGLDARVGPGEATPFQSFVRAQALLQLASALMDQSEDPRDAAGEAIDCARKGASADPARAQAIIAQAAALGGEYPAALRAARAALPPLWTATSDPAYVGALRALATSATQLAYVQLKAGQPVPASLVADAYLAGRTLLAHPAATEADATRLLDLAGAMGELLLRPLLLTEALRRFPASPELHRRLRSYHLEARGAASMGEAYDELKGSIDDPAYAPALTWFRGLALLVAAEWQLNQANPMGAASSYRASIAAFTDCAQAEPAFEDSARHYLVLAHAGAATLSAEAGDMEQVAQHLQAAAVLRPVSLDLKDGLGRTPRERAAKLLPALLPTLDEEHQAAFRRAFPE